MRKPHLASFVVGTLVLAAAAVPTVASAQPTAGAMTAAASATSHTVSAKSLLGKLHRAAETHASTYVRSRFRAWVDADHDGEDTRAEVLKAESSTRVSENTHGTVESGRWFSPYDGTKVTVASKLDIDHLVPLEEAWVSGAARWSAVKREAYANDLGYAADLIAVTAHANRSKGDRKPNAYLPPKRSYRCDYVKNYIAVKYRWGLSVDASEKNSLAADLAAYCTSLRVLKPGKPNIAQLTDVRGSVVTPAPVPVSDPEPSTTPTTTATVDPTPVETVSSTPTPTTSATTAAPTAADPDYGTCANAKAHHAHTPYYRGVDPEYAYYRDADGDGIVCE